MAFVFGGLLSMFATAYVANTVYDAAQEASLYVSERLDRVANFPSRIAENRRLQKQAERRNAMATYRAQLRKKYGIDQRSRGPKLI